MTSKRIAMIALVALFATFALPTTPAQTGEREFVVYLHENPLHVAPERININVGDTVVLQVKNFNPNPHDLLVCGDAPHAGSDCTQRLGFVDLPADEDGVIRFTAEKAGTFEFFCTIPGHKQGGMSGEIHVQGAEEPKSVPGAAPLLAVLTLAILALVARPRSP